MNKQNDRRSNTKPRDWINQNILSRFISTWVNIYTQTY